MDQLVYVYYVLLAILLLFGAKFYGKKKWNDGFLSLTQMKALQGFSAVGIMFHHLSQKTCAPWLRGSVIRHGLDPFVFAGYLFVAVFLFCSGYGLFKSYKQKKDYLKYFLRNRILPIAIAFYSTAYIFLFIRFLMGERMDFWHYLYHLTGLQLGNPNSWYVIAIPIFYLAFYLSFKYCKKEKTAVLVTCLCVFTYTLIGTCIDRNRFWFQGEWWYNSVHLFSIGLLLAKYEDKIIPKVKKYYVILLPLCIVIFVGFTRLTKYTEAVVSFHAEDFNGNFKIPRRWVCLLVQQVASCAFVFSIFLAMMKVKIGNRVLAFIGSITLEFYLIHGLFIELFGYSFLDYAPSLYYIKNVALFVLVVFALTIPSAVGLRKLHRLLLSLFQRRSRKKEEKA